FDGVSPTKGVELYKLGADGSVTLWTDINPGAGSSSPSDLTLFNDALWFNAFDGTSNQLYKLSDDGSLIKWTDINSANGGLNPQGMTVDNGALWFDGTNATNGGAELYKLGANGSVTLWADINPNGSAIPGNLTVFG